MRALVATLLLLAAGAPLLADDGVKKLRFQGASVRAEGHQEVVDLCFHAETGNAGASDCNLSAAYEDPRVDGRVEIEVRQVCDTVHEHATVTGDIWYLAAADRPDELLYRVDCGKKRAYPFSAPAGAPPPAPPAGLDPVAVSRRLERLEERLHKIEGPSGLTGLLAGQKGLETKLDELRRELSGKTKSGDSLACARADGAYGGRREVMLSVGPAVLRFLEIRPPAEPVAVGLSDARADELLREAQQGTGDPIFPHLLLAVGPVEREVPAFFLQDRLIDPGLYARLTGGGDARRVSHRDARQAVERLNAACAGLAKVDLPSEEQLVAAAHLLYNPVQHGLKPCRAVAAAGADVGLTELLGHAWHLTRSPCEPFGSGVSPSCDRGSYIRKGGAASSENPLECIPEYRSAAPEAVSQRETSFRLVLVE